MTKQEQIKNMIGVMSASNNPFVDVPIEIMPQVAKHFTTQAIEKSTKSARKRRKRFIT